jgi:hypothetical protein
MGHEYDLFEKFADGSSLWRGYAWGRESALHHLRAFAGTSDNQFYAIHLTTGKTIFPRIEPTGSYESRRSGKGTRAAAA